MRNTAVLREERSNLQYWLEPKWERGFPVKWLLYVGSFYFLSIRDQDCTGVRGTVIGFVVCFPKVVIDCDIMFDPFHF